MAIWGVGANAHLGGVAIVGAAGEFSLSLVWDHCGNAGLFIEGQTGPKVGTPAALIGGGAHVLAAENVRVLRGGATACLHELIAGNGQGGSIDVEGGVAGITAAIDATLKGNGLAFARASVGVEPLDLHPHVAAGANVYASWLLRFNTRPCPCELTWYEEFLLASRVEPFTSGYFFLKATGSALGELVGVQ